VPINISYEFINYILIDRNENIMDIDYANRLIITGELPYKMENKINNIIIKNRYGNYKL